MNACSIIRTAIVTGGAGFIGSCLVRRLVERRFRVINLDKLTYAANPDALASLEANERYKFIYGDITDHSLVRRLMAEAKPDLVFHLAAESHVDRSIDEPGDFVRTNIVGTFELLEAAYAAWSAYPSDKRDAFRFLHISTDEVFGMLGEEGDFNETSPYKPSSPYSASKAGSDHLVRAWHNTYGLPVIVTNCSNNFGPFQHPEKLIPTVILKAIAGQGIPIYGTGKNIRDWIYVDDHVEGLIEAAEKGVPGETYLFGGRSERTNESLARSICELLDYLYPNSSGRSYAEQITFVTDRPHHDFRYAIDPSKSERELGWRIRTPHEVGIEKTVRWYLDTPGAFLRSAGELERLGLARAKSKVRQVR